MDADELVLDEIHVPGLAVGREPHQLVLPRVHLEAGEVGEGGVEQAQRVRKADLAVQPDGVPAAVADRRRRPLAHAVHGDDGGLLERRGVERRRRMGLVVLREVDRRLVPAPGVLQVPLDVGVDPELVLHPQGTARTKDWNPRGATAMYVSRIRPNFRIGLS